MTEQEVRLILDKARLSYRVLEAKKEYLERIRQLAETVSGVDYSKEVIRGGAEKSRLAESVYAIVDYENDIEKDIETMVDCQRQADKLINLLESSLEKAVLIRRYKQDERWEDIAMDLHITFRHATRVNKAAISHICSLA